MNNNNVRVTDLPEFAQKKWRDTFLPTLYDKFFALEEPFSGFYKGSDEFVALLQSVIKEVYPDVDYEVNSSDSIHFLVCQVPCLNESTFIFFYIQAYNRVNEKWSSIGSTAINIMKQHLNTLKGENAAKDWLRWSLRIDGPLFFKVPSPMGSPIDQKDPKYQVSRHLIQCGDHP